MSVEQNSQHTLELYADELPEQVDLTMTAGVGGSTAATLTTASCPGSTFSTFTTLSSY